MSKQTEKSQLPHLMWSRRLLSSVPVLFVFLWSSGTIFAALGLHYTRPFTFLMLRLLFAAIIMWLICLYLRPSLPTTLMEWQHIIITGLFLQAGYQTFFFLTLAQNTSPGLLAIILGAQPILTSIFLREKTSREQWLGLILGMIGLILVVVQSIFLNEASAFGIMSALLSLASITIGTILQKHIQISLPMNMAIQYTGSTVVIVILAWLLEAFTVNWSLTFEVSLAWMVLIISTGATMLLYYMIRRGNLTNVTSLFYCVPPVTSLLDYLIFRHTLSVPALFGMIFIVAGLILINRQGQLI